MYNVQHGRKEALSLALEDIYSMFSGQVEESKTVKKIEKEGPEIWEEN